MNISKLSELVSSVPKPSDSLSGTTAREKPPQKVQVQEPAMGENAALTPTEVVEIVQKANNALMHSDANLKFVLDKESGERIVQVVDRETDEVLRQIPSVEMLKIAKAIEKMQGVLVSTQA